MRISEITESIIEEDVLSIHNFEKLMKMIKREIGKGNINYVKVKNRIIQRWNSGERMARKYDLDLSDFGTNVKSLLK